MALLEVEIMQLGLSVSSLSTMRSPLLRIVTGLPADRLDFQASAKELSDIARETEAAALSSIAAILDPALAEFSDLIEGRSKKVLNGVRDDLRKALRDLIVREF